MPVKVRRMRALQKRYGKKKGRGIYYAMEKHPKAYQVVVREGSAAPRPLQGMRLFETKREGTEALRALSHYQDEQTRIALRVVRR